MVPSLRGVFLGACVCLVLLAACGDKIDPGTEHTGVTFTQLPVCPAQPPSYSQTVAAVIKADCSPCHYPGGVEDSQNDFSTYAAVHAQSESMLGVIVEDLMPPPGAPALSASDSKTLLTWLVCNAPNN